MKTIIFTLWINILQYNQSFKMKSTSLLRRRRDMAKGFTLIELLIVIAILAILATLFMTMFPASQKRARDARRQSDIKQYQTALERYANKNNGNYLSLGPVDPSGQCSSLGLGSTCPQDPTNTGSFVYRYYGSATQYVLWARLEAIPDPTYFVVCSNGKAGQLTTAPSSETCPL